MVNGPTQNIEAPMAHWLARQSKCPPNLPIRPLIVLRSPGCGRDEARWFDDGFGTFIAMMKSKLVDIC